MSNHAGQDQQECKAAMREVAAAFRAKHGLEPEDVMVEFRKTTGGRMLWSLRKKSKAERDHLALKQVAIDKQALATQIDPVVYMVEPKSFWRWLRWPLIPTIVYLSKFGAQTAAGKDEVVVPVKVRA